MVFLRLHPQYAVHLAVQDLENLFKMESLSVALIVSPVQRMKFPICQVSIYFTRNLTGLFNFSRYCIIHAEVFIGNVKSHPYT